MTKNIIIAVLVIVSVFFVLFAKIKANEADNLALIAEKGLKMAEENEAKAKEQEKKATEAAARALIEHHKAEELQEQLDNCK